MVDVVVFFPVMFLDCVAGKYSSAGASSCINCAGGKYSDATGTSANTESVCHGLHFLCMMPFFSSVVLQMCEFTNANRIELRSVFL